MQAAPNLETAMESLPTEFDLQLRDRAVTSLDFRLARCLGLSPTPYRLFQAVGGEHDVARPGPQRSAFPAVPARTACVSWQERGPDERAP
jgi:hypothetical protein